MQEVEDSLEEWAVRLGTLSSMKSDLSQYLITDDVLLLQEQVEHLGGQWEELCLKVSLGLSHTHTNTHTHTHNKSNCTTLEHILHTTDYYSTLQYVSKEWQPETNHILLHHATDAPERTQISEHTINNAELN